jgi:release factor glutamine methyltransferase
VPDPQPAPDRPTVGSLLREATATLRPTSPTARLDAELLLAAVLGCERPRLIVDRDDPVAPEPAAGFRALVTRRAAHEPVAYLTGRRGFRWLELAVDPRVLIPRPETELLVELALTLPGGASVLDVGTGSGAVALAVKHERPDLLVTGVDISEAALAVARANGQRLALDVRFARADLLDGGEGAIARHDAILANLPYIAQDAVLEPDVAGHEPAGALRSGADGLDAIRRLVDQLARRPPDDRPALLALEIGADQGPAAAAVVQRLGYPQLTVLPDLAGLDRVVCARMSP